MGKDIRELWIELADDIGQTCLDVLGGKPLTVTAKGRHDPKVLVIKLTSRSLGHFRGIFLLLENDLVTEARVLVRCCWENAFWIAELVTNGDKFVEQMHQDEIHSHKKRAEFIFASGVELDAVVEERMREQLKEINKKLSKQAILSPQDVATKGVLNHGYLIYSQLSADAAHPSLTALARHTGLADGPEDGLIDVTPAPKPVEVVQTMDLACNAMLAACTGLNQILEGTEAGMVLTQLADRYAALQKRAGKRGRHHGAGETQESSAEATAAKPDCAI